MDSRQMTQQSSLVRKSEINIEDFLDYHSTSYAMLACSYEGGVARELTVRFGVIANTYEVTGDSSTKEFDNIVLAMEYYNNI